MNNPQKLRSLLNGRDLLMAPAIYDCISAKLVEQAGFKLAFSSGFGISASLLGKPDLGFLTATEVINRISYMAAAIDIPIIADMDTGYGGILNVIRTIEEAIQAGVGGVMLEDQEWPKRCGHFDDKQVVSAEEHVQKIKAAVNAASGSDLVIVARTDALAVHGIDEAIDRGRRYIDAGADILFIEAPESIEQIQRMANTFTDVPLVANMVEGGKTPMLSQEQLLTYGFKICTYGAAGVLSATLGMQQCFKQLAASGSTAGLLEDMSFERFKDIVNLDHYLSLQDSFKE